MTNFFISMISTPDSHNILIIAQDIPKKAAVFVPTGRSALFMIQSNH
ncbi:hypothetical protein HMPREF0080_00978 [Anaeroglobus geminatus F0357]|uniref:Uncharacterized protein n=1 Tax=Anaeroglobus geminatus F0357 TaxID=861450 RepID=G9YH50_9FIRM|nr:hypothetical protein HMPREF0080_00978 [Anaeroglobus geminatus F0357]